MILCFEYKSYSSRSDSVEWELQMERKSSYKLAVKDDEMEKLELGFYFDTSSASLIPKRTENEAWIHI